MAGGENKTRGKWEEEDGGVKQDKPVLGTISTFQCDV